MPTYGIALGSNLGDSLTLLTRARARLGGSPKDSAPIYGSVPVDCPPGSPPFLNTVIEISSPQPPNELLASTQDIELEFGREPQASRAHHAPRPVDIDLLYCGDTAFNSPDLILPHPRLHLRRFVLQPLADLRPDLVLPGFSESTSTLLAKLQSDEPPLTLVSSTW